MKIPKFEKIISKNVQFKASQKQLTTKERKPDYRNWGVRRENLGFIQIIRTITERIQ